MGVDVCEPVVQVIDRLIDCKLEFVIFIGKAVEPVKLIEHGKLFRDEHYCLVDLARHTQYEIACLALIGECKTVIFIEVNDIL